MYIVNHPYRARPRCPRTGPPAGRSAGQAERPPRRRRPAGYAINPARDSGPWLAAHITGYGGARRDQYGNYFWVPIVGGLMRRSAARSSPRPPLGAACVAGLATGFWRDTEELRAN
jgi:hypothetical protein